MFCIFYLYLFLFFFFQAEDGIRDWSVTGVQTCALPICVGDLRNRRHRGQVLVVPPEGREHQVGERRVDTEDKEDPSPCAPHDRCTVSRTPSRSPPDAKVLQCRGTTVPRHPRGRRTCSPGTRLAGDGK